MSEPTPTFPTDSEQQAYWEKHDRDSDFRDANPISEIPFQSNETDNDYIGELEMFLKYDV